MRFHDSITASGGIGDTTLTDGTDGTARGTTPGMILGMAAVGMQAGAATGVAATGDGDIITITTRIGAVVTGVAEVTGVATTTGQTDRVPVTDLLTMEMLPVVDKHVLRTQEQQIDRVQMLLVRVQQQEQPVREQLPVRLLVQVLVPKVDAKLVRQQLSRVTPLVGKVATQG